ncbi:MAG: RNA polymerase subunit sigma-70 [Bacteroidales bacterium]|nr:RNA polymerase subunit sigma-70 [Bacteroidales bacterium]
MIRATISADIVSSTALSVFDLMHLQSVIRQFLDELSVKSQDADWGRLFKGDSVEIFLSNPHEALRTALLLKALVKKTFVESNMEAKQSLFKKFGIRIAIGIGEMRMADKNRDVLDGEAIYYSGRALEKGTKEGLSVKRSMYFACKDSLFSEQMDVMLGLLDMLFKEATSKQCEVLYYKLMGMNEVEIAEKLGVVQSVVNQHSNAIGWNAIESAVNYFEKLNFES